MNQYPAQFYNEILKYYQNELTNESNDCIISKDELCDDSSILPPHYDSMNDNDVWATVG